MQDLVYQKTMAFHLWKQVKRTGSLPYILTHSRNSLFLWEHADFGSVFPSDLFIRLWQCLITLSLFDSIWTHTHTQKDEHVHSHTHAHTHIIAVGGGQVSAGGIERYAAPATQLILMKNESASRLGTLADIHWCSFLNVFSIFYFILFFSYLFIFIKHHGA